jgi:hypothetical protein
LFYEPEFLQAFEDATLLFDLVRMKAKKEAIEHIIVALKAVVGPKVGRNDEKLIFNSANIIQKKY